MISRHLLTRMHGIITNNGHRQIQNYTCDTYGGAIDALNALQSNAQYLRNMRNKVLTPHEEHTNTILQTEKYMTRSGLSLEKLDTLSVIHVTGTKGKGSTCAFCENILRQHGYKTGFFSSPHLLEVRERIRINGRPLEKDVFTSHFWSIYNKLRDNCNNMPAYFKFLTILAFNIFIREKVDVAVIEVGIGGEYDCTNVLRKVAVAGITSLGLDHTGLLGDTIEKIAWHKAGIMKKGSQVFTVPQGSAALKILEQRSIERECSLEIIESKSNVAINEPSTPMLQMNAMLAVALAESWISTCGSKTISQEAINRGISTCFWPGRYQIIYTNDITYYLDGAHTAESIAICSRWFKEKTVLSTNKKVLIFNATGDRDSVQLLKELQYCNFDVVCFVPNIATVRKTADNVNYNVPPDEQLQRCIAHRKIWLNLQNINKTESHVKAFATLYAALQELSKEHKYDILVTGSLHLVGAMLSILDPELRGNVCQNAINNKTCLKN